jgi:hypothetical protein
MITLRACLRRSAALLALAGTFAIAERAEAQLSSNASMRVLQSGAGWKLLEVPQPERGALPKQVWVVHRDGIAGLPVSSLQKSDLQADFSAEDGRNTLIFIDRAAVENAERTASFSFCEWGSTHTVSKSYNYNNSPLSPREFSLGSSGIDGTYGVNLPLTGNAQVDIRYKIKYCGWPRLPVKLKLVDGRLRGAASLNGDGDLSAFVSLHGHWEKEWPLVEPIRLGEFWIYFIRIDVTLPIFVGASIDAAVTGNVGLDADFGASGSFDYTCTSDGCTGSNTFQDHFDAEDVTASVTLDIKAKAWARVMARFAVYDDSILYGEGGLKGNVHADLWGYLGNTCGDADGDGTNEQVRALAADINWSYGLVWGYGYLSQSPHLEERPGDLHYLYWRDLLGPGGSTALQPMLQGPSSLNVGAAGTYTAKMRPCYPYSDRVNISMAPGVWTGNMFIAKPKSGDPAENSTALTHVFSDSGPTPITITAVSDAHGRNLGVPYTRTIQVSCGDTTPPTVALSAPTPNQYVSGNVAFAANASDNRNVARVEFEVDGSVVCSDTSAPYACSADLNAYASGAHSVRARALDGCGNETLTAGVTVQVVSAPLMNLDEPATGASVSGQSVVLSGWATDPNRVTSVVIKLDGAPLNPTSATSRPDVCQNLPVGDPNCPNVGFRSTFDSTQYSNGAHSLQVIATDATGRSTTIQRSIEIRNALTPCSPGPNTLCLRNRRFKAEITYVNGSGYGQGQSREYSDESGFFWFFNANNIEAGVKVLGPANGYWWVFHGAATDRQYTLSVTDTETGVVKTYLKPAGSFCGSTDLQAFPATGQAASWVPPLGLEAAAEEQAPADAAGLVAPTAAGTCVPGATAVCLANGRFKAEVLRAGVAQSAVALTPDTGAFWFFNGANAETFVKVLDGTPINGRFWVFYGSLSDRDFTVRVTDTTTGAVQTYVNALGNYCGSGDTTAF